MPVEVWVPSGMQFSAHPPSPFICNHQSQLLPSWSLPARSILVVLQRCECALTDRTHYTETHKNNLRDRFLKVGYSIVTHLTAMGYLADIFDPQTGLPLLSNPGQLHLDDVAIARSTLGYSTHNSGGCDLIVHPLWGNAVYPSTIISSAPPAVMEAIASRTLANLSQS